jgi:ornithine cyclodeaminase
VRILSLDEIRAAFDLDLAFDAVEAGFIADARHQVSLGAVGYHVFPEARGDCHIKSASSEQGAAFVVKIATSFAGNGDHGLPTNNGLMVLLSARTGEPLALLRDEGWLTDVRTAIAGALAAEVILPERATTLGIVGTGAQAKLQAELAARRTGMRRVLLWGRRAEPAARLASDLVSSGLDARAVGTLEELAEAADVVITTTPSREPLLTAGMFTRPARIVAVGADAPGKQEIASDLTARMDALIVDSPEQCLDHGELSRPHAEGRIDESRIRHLGDALLGGARFAPDQWMMVDLTGVGIQDLQIASTVWSHVPGNTSSTPLMV